jgi:hypothetical protein
MKRKPTKHRAAMLLRKYDMLREELRYVEHSLTQAVTQYGKEMGYWGLSRDHFRTQLQNEERLRQLQLQNEENVSA